MTEIIYQTEKFSLYDWLGALSDEKLTELVSEGGMISADHMANMSPEQLHRFFGHVSLLIDKFRTNPKTLNEMLPQPPGKLEAAFREGNSAIFAIVYGGEALPIAHSAMWPLIDIPAGDNHNPLCLYEFGSWIVEDHFRGKGQETDGLTLGEAVAQKNISEIYTRDNAQGRESASIATVKRLNSMRGLQRIGFHPESFHEHPFSAALTCTCGNSSEIYIDHVACPYRRTDGVGESHIIGINDIGYRVNNDFVLPNGNGGPKKIPCTFMAHNLPALDNIETTLEMLYERDSGPHHYSGTVDRDSIMPLVTFYQKYGVSY